MIKQRIFSKKMARLINFEKTWNAIVFEKSEKIARKWRENSEWIEQLKSDFSTL